MLTSRTQTRGPLDYMSPPPAAIMVNEPEVIRAPANSWRRSPVPAAIMVNEPEVMRAPARKGDTCTCQTSPPPAAIIVNEPEVIRAPVNNWRRTPEPAAIMVNDPEVMSAPARKGGAHTPVRRLRRQQPSWCRSQRSSGLRKTAAGGRLPQLPSW